MIEGEVKVSIFCMVYNHEKYLRKCLDGFIMQKTNFKFEALVHDDASTDNSANIIREYAKKYPYIIKPIFQIENQYSKGISIDRTYIFPKAQGKYIAYCEGDDFWTSPYKLQRQFDYMEENDDCSMCVHQSCAYDIENKTYHLITESRCERDYSPDEIIRGGGGIFSTNSFFIRKDIYEKMPVCFLQEGVGDYQLMMYGSMSGRFHYIPVVLSVYNCGVQGSWTARHKEYLEVRIRYLEEQMRMLNLVNEYYNYKYNESIQWKLQLSQYWLEVHTGKREEIQLDMNQKKIRKKRDIIKKFIPFSNIIISKVKSLLALYEVKKGMSYYGK